MTATFTVALNVFPMYLEYKDWCPGRLWKWVTGISLGVKAAGEYGWWPATLVVPNVKKSWASTYLEPLGLPRPVAGWLLPDVQVHSPWQYTVCHRRNGPNFGRMFLMLKYTDITQNTYTQSWTVTEIMAREVWNFDSCYTLTDCQIHIEIGRNMWFL